MAVYINFRLYFAKTPFQLEGAYLKPKFFLSLKPKGDFFIPYKLYSLAETNDI